MAEFSLQPLSRLHFKQNLKLDLMRSYFGCCCCGLAWTMRTFCRDWNCWSCSCVRTMGFPDDDCTMNCPEDVDADDDGCDVATVTEEPGICWRLARMNCRPPIETMELGVAVTGEAVEEVRRVGSIIEDWGCEACVERKRKCLTHDILRP